MTDYRAQVYFVLQAIWTMSFESATGVQVLSDYINAYILIADQVDPDLSAELEFLRRVALVRGGL